MMSAYQIFSHTQLSVPIAILQMISGGFLQVYKQWAVGYGVRNSDTDKTKINFVIDFTEECLKVYFSDIGNMTASDATFSLCFGKSKDGFLWNAYYIYNPSQSAFHDYFFYFALGY